MRKLIARIRRWWEFHTAPCYYTVDHTERVGLTLYNWGPTVWNAYLFGGGLDGRFLSRWEAEQYVNYLIAHEPVHATGMTYIINKHKDI